MNQQQRNHLKNQLQQQRQKLASISGGAEPDLSISMNEETGELSGYDNHPADLGSEMYERSLSFTLSEHEEQELEEVDYALQKMQAGTYGICESCGRDIPYERLEAMPTARYCMKHQKLHDIEEGTEVPYASAHRQNRPAEEAILSPRTTKSSDAGRENAWKDVAQYNDRPHDLEENKE